MVLLIDAVCACGYIESGPDTLRYGQGARAARGPGGHLRFEPHGPDWQPAYCRTCRRVVNVGEASALCPACATPAQLYSDPALYAVPDDAPPRSAPKKWEPATKGGKGLLLLRFLCPRCERMDLRFVPSPYGGYD